MPKELRWSSIDELLSCRGHYIVPLGKKRMLAARQRVQIAMSGVIGDITLEKHHLVPLVMKSVAQTPPEGGMPVSPGGTESQAQNHEFHRGIESKEKTVVWDARTIARVHRSQKGARPGEEGGAVT